MVVQRKIKGLIAENEITQKELADVLGISREMMNRKINGVNNFTLNEAFIVSNYFGKPIDEIFLAKKLTKTKPRKRGKENGS